MTSYATQGRSKNSQRGLKGPHNDHTSLPPSPLLCTYQPVLLLSQPHTLLPLSLCIGCSFFLEYCLTPSHMDYSLPSLGVLSHLTFSAIPFLTIIIQITNFHSLSPVFLLLQTTLFFFITFITQLVLEILLVYHLFLVSPYLDVCYYRARNLHVLLPAVSPAPR